MNYEFKIENLDCASCAAKLEASIGKISGIKECFVNFFTLKMKLTLCKAMDDDVLKMIFKAAKKVEPDIKLSLVS